jgi:hypothetical protein
LARHNSRALFTSAPWPRNPLKPACWPRPLKACSGRFDRLGPLMTHSGPRRNTHSISSSARASSEAGTVRPKAFTVLRLITSSSLVLCWMGRSAGLAPLRIFPAHAHLVIFSGAHLSERDLPNDRRRRGSPPGPECATCGHSICAERQSQRRKLPSQRYEKAYPNEANLPLHVTEYR